MQAQSKKRVGKIWDSAYTFSSCESTILSDASTIFECSGKGNLIGVTKVDAEWQAASEACDFDIGIFLVEHFLKQERGRFAFDAGVGGNDNLFNIIWFDAGEKFFDMELVGGDAVDGANGATENVISTVVALCLFDGINIKWLFDDEDGGFIAFGVIIELGNFIVGVDKGKGDRATFDAVMEASKSYRDIFGDTGAVFE